MELVVKLLIFSVSLTLLIPLLSLLVVYIGIFAENKKREKRYKRRKNKNELYSDEEFARFEKMSRSFGADWIAEEDELRDLLAAGIIEKEEFDDRMSHVR